jgi:5-methylcytosine-specific restriction enzyme A
MRWVQLMKQPLCQECQRQTPSRVTSANVVHHAIPHKGDPVIFWDATVLESVCKRCHDTILQSRERGGAPPA